MESRITASGGERLGGGGTELLGERIHGHGQNLIVKMRLPLLEW